MEKYIRKFEMRKIITIMCVMAGLFSFFIGSIGIILSGKMNENVNYIYDYRHYTKLVETINTNVLKMGTELLKASDGFDTVYEERIKESNQIIIKSIDEYNSTEYESDIEEEYVKNLNNSYKEYYNVVEGLLKQYKGGKEILNKADAVDKMETLEQKVLEDISLIISYLDDWAAQDKDTTNSIYNTIKIAYITIIIAALVIMTICAVVVIRVFTQESQYINYILNRVATGDLSVELHDNDTSNEFDKMKNSLKTAVESFRKMISEIKEKSSSVENDSDSLSMVSSELAASVDNISTVAENITGNMEEQSDDLNKIVSILDNFSDNIEEFISNLNELNSNSNDITKNAEKSNTKLDETSVIFKEIKSLVDNFTVKINNLGTAINKISGVTNFINELAEQTNLLALNATIESARVGEAGKGFAVVASEISELAEQSRKSVNRISEYISEISKDTLNIIDDSNELNDKLGKSLNSVTESLDLFKNIIEHTSDIDCKIKNLNTASQNISRENEVLYDKIEKSSKRSDDICALSEEVTSSINEINGGSRHVSETALGLNKLSNELEEQIKIFKI
ncbi:MAG: methyl-accepting chemotaxis protein [Clostridium sp.]|nr:methyl-accepting chemotaxis protein [Clostridium sp.]